jgi:hypothetical protein
MSGLGRRFSYEASFFSLLLHLPHTNEVLKMKIFSLSHIDMFRAATDVGSTLLGDFRREMRWGERKGKKKFREIDDLWPKIKQISPP